MKVLGITKLCEHPRPSAPTHDNPRPPLISHNFAAVTSDQPKIFCYCSQPPTPCHYFKTATHYIELYQKINSFKAILRVLHRLTKHAF